VAEELPSINKDIPAMDAIIAPITAISAMDNVHSCSR
jgi:hypothetical protein